MLLVLHLHHHRGTGDNGEAVILDVQVPDQYADVLQSLTRRASAVSADLPS